MSQNYQIKLDMDLFCQKILVESPEVYTGSRGLINHLLNKMIDLNLIMSPLDKEFLYIDIDSSDIDNNSILMSYGDGSSLIQLTKNGRVHIILPDWWRTSQREEALLQYFVDGFLLREFAKIIFTGNNTNE